MKKLKATVHTLRFQSEPSTVKNNFGKKFVVFTINKNEINDADIDTKTNVYMPGMRNKHLIGVNGNIEETIEEGNRVEIDFDLKDLTYDQKYSMFVIKSKHLTKLNEISQAGFLRYLKNNFKGLGESTSTKIFNYLIGKYGEENSSNFLEHFNEEVLKKDNKDFLKVLSVKKIASIKEQILEKKKEDDKIKLNEDELFFSANHDINPNFILRLKKQIIKLSNRRGSSYKEHNVIPYLKKTPYLLAIDSSLKGFGFKTIDSKVFQFSDFKDWNDIEFIKQRILGFLKYTLLKKQDSGHLFCEKQEIFDAFVEYNEKDKEGKEFDIGEDIEEFNSYIIDIISTLADDINPFLIYEGRYFLKDNFKMELQIARRLQFINNNFPLDKKGLDKFTLKRELIELEEQEGIKLSSEQTEAVVNSAVNKISIITGGPGTGKTTISNMLIKLLEKKGKTIKLLAPTGTAAKRISLVSGLNATTIHRGLEFSGKFNKNFDDPLNEDVVIVDESSMVDVFLGLALSEGARKSQLIFIGDVNQLPSVGAGDFLRDLINSKQFHVSHLTQIFRQAGDSPIVQFAYKVNDGAKLPEFFNWYSKKDTLEPKLMILAKDQFKKSINGEDNPDYLKNIMKAGCEYGYKTYLLKSDDYFQAQVLVSNNRSNDFINKYLQNELNNLGEKIPYKDKVADSRFRVNDKIIQNKNNYKLNVFNGSIGIIKEYLKGRNTVLIQYSGETELKEIPVDVLNTESKLCYSMTIHKSQGQEFPRVIMLVNDFLLNSRELIYTGATRAKENLIIITNSLLLTMGIGNSTQKTGEVTGRAARNTKLLDFLQLNDNDREELFKDFFEFKPDIVKIEEEKKIISSIEFD